jgi:integrase
MGKLGDPKLREWIKAGKALAKSDGDGLTFTLSAAGTAAWVLRYRVGGKQKELSLGRYPDISLKRAREIATAKRAEVQQGVDVAAEKRRGAQEAARAWTFARLADDYLEKAGARLAPATMKQRRQQLRDYINPKIGPLRAAEVSPADVVGIAETLSRKSLHVARLTLITLREVFAHGVARHVLTANPCAHVKAKAVIGGRPDQRERVMLKDAEIAVMLPALAGIGKQNELTVRILLATAARIGELTRAEWQHVDFERAEWRIPPEHSKTRKPFVIPLAPAVAGWFAELKALAFGSRYVLPIRCPRGEKTDRPMEPTTLNAALNQLAERLEERCRRFTPHDLRATCRSHLGALGVDVLIAERCLNHSLGGLVAVYDKHDYLPERRRALELWAAKLSTIEAGAGFNIVPLKRA